MSGTAPTDRLTPLESALERPVYHHDERGTYHTWCEYADYEPATTTLLVAVASVFGVEPDELEPLTARVDPDALNALVEHWHEADADRGSVSFSYAACDVTIRADGEIVIEPHRPVRPDR